MATLHAEEPPDPAHDWLAFMDATDPLRWQKQPAWPELAEAQDRRLQQIFELGTGFFARHPTDSRRWKAVVLALSAEPFYAKAYPPAEPGATFDAYRLALPRDEGAFSAWEKRCRELTAQLRADPATPIEIKEASDYAILGRQLQAGVCMRRSWVELSAELERHLAWYSSDVGLAGVLAERAKALVEMVRQSEPAEALPLAKALETKLPEPMNLRVRAGEPLEMKFTATDGREVDLASFRRRQGSGEARPGKVVLVDFWATWCGPCREELPNLRRVHAAYRDMGFEVIGISLDQDRARFDAFCEKEPFPWPQYFDGKGWRNRFGREHGITALPTVFLLDREGRLVSTDARGEKLEPAVKALLGL